MRYRVDINRAQFDAADVIVLDNRGHARPDDTNVVHVFTDDDLGRDGHMPVCDCDVTPGMYHPIMPGDGVTHVAIPVEQYVRIFGEL